MANGQLIRVLANGLMSGETTVGEVVEAAKQGAGLTQAPAAIISRDANGKVVSVDVHLPVEVSAADLQKAADAINLHPGISIASVFPFQHEDNFNTLTPGSTLLAASPGVASVVSGGKTIDLFSAGNSTEIKAAASVDSMGGTGSAIEWNGTGTTFMFGGALVSAATHGIACIRAFEIEADIKAPSLGSPGVMFNLSLAGGLNALTSSFVHAMTSVQTGGGPNNYQTPTLGDTGISNAGYIHIKLTLDALGNYVSTVGPNVESGTLAVPFCHENMGIVFLAFSASGPLNAKYFMDNYKVKVTDGTLI